MDIIAVCNVGRQFPDKAIDLIDEACATAAKRMMKIGKQEKKVNNELTTSRNAVKEAIVGPNEVAQVGILFLLISVYAVQSMI
jgi:ATP-dependent Clp protease ATP-binding subunit ClpA